jgi:hypothetical protein
MVVIPQEATDIGDYIYIDRRCKYCGNGFNVCIKYCMATNIDRHVFCRCPNKECNKLVCVLKNEGTYVYNYIRNHTTFNEQDTKEMRCYNDELVYVMKNGDPYAHNYMRTHTQVNEQDDNETISCNDGLGYSRSDCTIL